MHQVFRRYRIAFEVDGGPDLVNLRFDPVGERGVGLFVQVDHAKRLLFGNDEELTSAEILDRLAKSEGESRAEGGLAAELLRQRAELFKLRWAEDEAWDEMHERISRGIPEHTTTPANLLSAAAHRIDIEEAFRRFREIHREHMEAHFRFEKFLADYLTHADD